MGTESAAAVEVVRSVSVPLPQAQTFELFAEVVVEPRSGGRWFERGVDGSECLWGRVAAWDPPRKVVLLWQIGADWQFDPNFETEVEVTFTDDGAGRTRVDLRHRNLERYGDSAEQMRAIFDDPSGWAGTLARFAGVAAETAHRKS
ncbi:SRPBCC family protein [Mycobacterium noviomagense]|uniref:ATPase n=1 Tax=Mycobacterium noviomagense TaxID=459858 RepID=A0A7I7PHW0_9MYCO|nr:SRPBCC family protein [Mycobacterium noviomagense]ORB16843.1 ATPase [Mycobacterium noviomagense]BBY08194.1 hypothetical protein MNVI_35120 [Mycobacterium noviomagense]